MGNCWKKMYYSLPRQEICPYCKKKQFISEQETAFKISTSGCRICRIKNKYYFKPVSVSITKVPVNQKLVKKPSYNRIYDPDPFNNVSNTKVSGRYH